MFSGNLVAYPVLIYLNSILVPKQYQFSLTISIEFIISFFVIENVLSACLTFHTPHGKTEPMEVDRLLKSVFYGFLNARTYFLILFPLLIGFEISLNVWLVDYLLGISGKLSVFFASKIMNYDPHFYHSHRMNHLPLVYQDAHKFHHFLHDASPFDAHLYGSGAPEEWFTLWSEIIPSFFLGVLPPALTYSVLYISWSNKREHSRREIDKGYYNNHVDHHTHHIKNYSWVPVLDMFFGTSVNNDYIMYAFTGYSITKKENGEKLEFLFKPEIIS